MLTSAAFEMWVKISFVLLFKHTHKRKWWKKMNSNPVWAFGDKLESYWKDTYKESKKNSSYCMEEKLVRNVFSPSAALMKSRDL